MTQIDSQGIRYSQEGRYYVVGDSTNKDQDNNADVQKNIVKAIIESRINGIKVTAIGKYAFRFSTSLESAFIPNTVKELRFDCFSNNLKFSNIDFASDSELKIIDHGAFYATSIKIINLPKSIRELRYLCFAKTSIKTLFACSNSISFGNYVFGTNGNFISFPSAIYVNEKYSLSYFGDSSTNIKKTNACSMRSYITIRAQCSSSHSRISIMILITTITKA